MIMNSAAAFSATMIRVGTGPLNAAIPLTLSGKLSYNGGAVKSASMLDIVYLNTVCAGARREP